MQRSTTTSPSTSVIGFVGLGRMGQPMTRHLRQAGYRVRGYDPDPHAGDVARSHGVATCDSAAAAAEGCDVVFLMPGTTKQVQAALTGADGVLAGAAPGTVVVVSSTISPSDARAFGAECASAGMRFLDAPVARGEAGAHDGDLLWFVGGDGETLDAVRPALEPCGKEIFHLGPVGTGMVGKAMNNLLLWAAAIADREAIALASEFGVDTETLISALLRSSGMNQFLNYYGKIDRFPWSHKDMKIISAMADEVGLSLPLAGMLREMVKPLMIETGCREYITH
ncbi:MAG TPA: NAD(P)-dependent oxidoreductase [Pseudonocardia sp.]|uniref:NAD(P)-dependent oxidoreductase n=1 Tax=Pseudonocardia sp. TaxID=60912 RepID=UPI002B4B7B50|nr:NAD(P)-dependent oxidoreductase [Pseudonocardia sp.]HLU56128.1 NAD(P)-dependent oxidoreductase [Pseudonocardia sp.]